VVLPDTACAVPAREVPCQPSCHLCRRPPSALDCVAALQADGVDSLQEAGVLKQDQLIIDGAMGDCMRACVATITGIDIKAVPNFVDPDIAWDDHMGPWLHRHGWALIDTYQDRSPRDYNWTGLQGMVAMASVPSQLFPGGRHAIVVGWRQHPEHESALEVYVVHDPNPRNQPYVGVEKLIMNLRWVVALPSHAPIL
jgi:hypothetical protein